MKHPKSPTPRVCLALLCLFLGCPATNGADSTVDSQLQSLREQNLTLQEQLRQQQEMIETLKREVHAIRERESQSSADRTGSDQAPVEPNTPSAAGFRFGNLQVTGEAAVGWFHSGRQGEFPNAEFRVDEAKIFLDAAVWGDVYAFAEINLAARESSDLNLRLGEFYADIEDLSQLWGRSGQLNLRVGRMDIPFGEEYQVRDAIDNPLISHSLMDFWGVDEGIELYGTFGPVSYALAVQNGGISVTRDFTRDKSVAGRIGWDPTRWLHLSVSGMRTGDLSVERDELSEIWFGNGWFRSIGSAATTRFHANLVEGDIELRGSKGHLKAFGGYVAYDDNDPLGDNGRDVYFYSVEGVWHVTRKFYAGSRFGQILAPDGYPIVGNGDMGHYLFGPSLTESLWRLSLGLGYRWNRNFVVKAEYCLERGRETTGAKRNRHDLIATQAALAF